MGFIVSFSMGQSGPRSQTDTYATDEKFGKQCALFYFRET